MRKIDEREDAFHALYEYWLRADAARNALLALERSAGRVDVRRQPIAPGRGPVPASVIWFELWAGLLYVAMEGYAALGCRSRRVARLAYRDPLKRLGRLRNAVFRFQPTRAARKHQELAKLADDKFQPMEWLHGLHTALGKYLKSEIRLAARRQIERRQLKLFPSADALPPASVRTRRGQRPAIGGGRRALA
ncbi:MAG TPA: hypothetical protein VF342_08465 [Alphaproteobacteria bacterium]